MNILLFGAPGVGKGTYAERLSKEYGLTHISTGDLFRYHIKNQTELGKKVEEQINQGHFASDEDTIAMVEQKIAELSGNNILFDGFPRTLVQATALDKLVKVDKVLYFTADDEVIISRLSSRRQCKKCRTIYNLFTVRPKEEGKCDNCDGELYQRDDDKPEAIKERLLVYRGQTKPVIVHYKAKGLVAEINANITINEIVKEAKRVLGGI